MGAVFLATCSCAPCDMCSLPTNLGNTANNEPSFPRVTRFYSFWLPLDVVLASEADMKKNAYLCVNNNPAKGALSTPHAYFATSSYTPLKHSHMAPRTPSRRKKNAVASGRTACTSKYTTYVNGGVFGPRGGYNHRPLRVESRSWCDAPGTKTIAAALLLNVTIPVIAAFGG